MRLGRAPAYLVMFRIHIRQTVKGLWSALATFIGALGIALALENSSLGSTIYRWLPYTGSYLTSVPETMLVSARATVVSRGPRVLDLTCRASLHSQLNLHSLVLIATVLVPTVRHRVDPPNSQSISSVSTKSSIVIFFLAISALFASTFSSPTCQLNPYLPSSLFCSSQASTGPVRLLASQQSITGRVVLGETMVHNLTLRYLRVDHSLLGGLWMMPTEQEAGKGESSRLAVGHEGMDDEEAALRRAESIYVTGLIARSLEQHGIVTSLVEIDPVVYQYARDHFGVKNVRGEIALEDALEFLSRRQGQETYDYIIHDVFTGGTVPISLFTMKAWALVQSSLTVNGLVAINFAGIVDSPTSHVVLSTILASFHHCIFLGDGGLTRSSTSFSNLAIFCSAQPGRKVVLRQAVASDYLDWPSPRLRRKILGNFHDYVQDLDELIPAEKSRDVLRGKTGERRLKDLQRGSAELHWSLMNKVLPLEVWDVY
ncbi:BQ2448_1119 [Microbotryum intermedium]|uniref:BQ2448_1119 protein n=1 Tax=Microbotryum intermedium TaxID=269621 RepID=A0A238F944_9BASI|nr:BQ2448_1119 [Microbotryum intermedium]